MKQNLSYLVCSSTVTNLLLLSVKIAGFRMVTQSKKNSICDHRIIFICRDALLCGFRGAEVLLSVVTGPGGLDQVTQSLSLVWRHVKGEEKKKKSKTILFCLGINSNVYILKNMVSKLLRNNWNIFSKVIPQLVVMIKTFQFIPCWTHRFYDFFSLTT